MCILPPGLSTTPTHHLPATSHELRSDLCAVSVAIPEGGRIASLRSLRSGLEFLTQARENRQPVTPGLTTPFQTGPCAGIEECLPTVGPSGPETVGGPAPDHGDFWQIPWTLVDAHGSDSLILEAFAFSRPFRFQKQLSLSGATLRVVYTLENVGDESLPFLYACHPLFAVDPGDRILLPPEVKKLNLYYSRNGRLGEQGTALIWPVTSTGELLDRAGRPEDRTAEMFYTGKLTDSHCAIHRTSTGEAIEIEFSLDTLPYLGLWLCYGGWPDSGEQPLQYAVALEPTTSPCNTLTEAVANGSAPWIAAKSTTSWHISFTLVEAAI